MSPTTLTRRNQMRAREWKRLGIDFDNERYDKMLQQQNGVCKLCGNQPERRQRLAVDHSHTTGEIRGLLCYPCNISLGWYEKIDKLLLSNYLSAGPTHRD